MFCICLSGWHALEVVSRGSETQLQVGENNCDTPCEKVSPRGFI